MSQFEIYWLLVQSQGSILTVVPWAQASKNTNGPLKCLSARMHLILTRGGDCLCFCGVHICSQREKMNSLFYGFLFIGLGNCHVINLQTGTKKEQTSKGLVRFHRSRISGNPKLWHFYIVHL